MASLNKAQLVGNLGRDPEVRYTSIGTAITPVPEGMAALDTGVYALQQGAPETTSPSLGIGKGDNLQPTGGENPFVLGSKACVGRRRSQTSVQTGYGENASSVLVVVYDRAVIMDSARSPNAIDVFLNNALYRRVRW